MFSHQSPIGPCVGGNPGVRSARDNVASVPGRVTPPSKFPVKLGEPHAIALLPRLVVPVVIRPGSGTEPEATFNHPHRRYTEPTACQ
jgi:hypothetical protein